jgi:succinoglycan biosynthesis transport protein ExoP
MNYSHYGVAGQGHARVPALADYEPTLIPEFTYANAQDAATIDLVKLWAAVWRNRLVIATIVIVSLAFGVLSLFLSEPTYRATASVEINNQPVKVLGTEEFQQSSSSQETDRLLQTEIDILRSGGLAERVVDDLHLASDPRLASPTTKPVSPQVQHQRIVDKLKGGLVVTLPRNSRVVPVSFDSSDPALAAKIANSYVDNLIASNLQRHFDTSRYSKEFLQNQLELTKARLEQSERALLDYARSVGIVDPNAGVGENTAPGDSSQRSLTSSNLVDLNQSLAVAQNARIQAQGRWLQAQSTPIMSLPDVLTNPAIQQMTQKRAELQSQYEQDLQRRKPEHPAVQQEAAAIRELDRQIATLAGSVRDSIRNQYLTAQKQESELAGAVGHLKGSTLAEQQLGIRYNILKREVTTNRELYNGLLQRYKEVSAEAGVTSNNISIVDRAEAPLFPISPKPLINLFLATLIGLVVAMIVVAALEIFHDGVRAPDEVERRFGIPLLGHTPLLPKGETSSEHLLLPNSQISEAYQTIRTSVELSTEQGNPQTMMITSSRAGEGKSTTAIAIARDAALSGRKILLIDGDMRRPSLHKLLNKPREPGLSTFLTQQVSAESIVVETDTPGLFLIPAGPKPPNPAELISGGAIKTLLNYLSQSYDQIIIDAPPVLGIADAPRFASVVDATMFIIEANRSQRGAIEGALRRLASARAHIIGAVLVKFNPRTADPSYSYLADYYGYSAEEDEAPTAGLIASRNVS